MMFDLLGAACSFDARLHPEWLIPHVANSCWQKHDIRVILT